ncbi:undecaprenyl/decaprenyl-phosphate alpha-N-acetylglucosaminyl 1-phosphate transferase [Dyella sp.]|uniref:undecaprenyl/decaprenyl-phosphate alpha-N-acetylglucosaminyl 1-phosphate transferase n=1 Tax=Dyella sp. TaxID=1869338 RepID=UPI002D769F0C|nr:undecaprenyl/decaprenyl-phosphate alpha-N-acetylglucosaminyl 1-phosphate transferase [Dyella sp.]HET6431616.1 undecaprenyl/decaprenyl-phosphate alpha-N-acetylglucosaminyl 1-phosphate transferase [Dyella sp.]
MEYYRILLPCAVATFACTTTLALLYRHACTLGLVDCPNERKTHMGQVPLIGGIAVFTGVMAGWFFAAPSDLFARCLLGTGAALVLLGALDDRFELSVRSRLLVQTAAVLTMVSVTGVYIHTLGRAFGYELELGVAGIPLTLIAVIGLLNAFNMMDGIDGLAGMLALVGIGGIAVYQGIDQWPSLGVLLLLAAALLPYLAVNLGLVGRKVFLGDAGSVVLGYLLAWMLIRSSQTSSGPHLSTVDVVWSVALPVLDTLAVMTRRMREGKSPFKPDRGHIHHLMLNAGFGPRATLAALVLLAASLVGVGMLTRRLNAGSNMLSFGALAVIYIAMHSQVWRRQQLAAVRERRRAVRELPRKLAQLVALDARATATESGPSEHTQMRRKTDRQSQG